MRSVVRVHLSPFPVAMRLGETPVPIPNTMVKTQEADGTMLETAWESRWLPGSLKDLLIDFKGTKQVWQYGSGRCTLKTAHRKFSIKRAMQTANDADGGNIFPDITAEEAGYSATARIERKRERTRDGALRRNVRKRHQISMIRKN